MSLTKGFYGGEQDIGPEADRIAVIKTALAKGVTLLSTADLYGPYDNHVLIGTHRCNRVTALLICYRPADLVIPVICRQSNQGGPKIPGLHCLQMGPNDG